VKLYIENMRVAKLSEVTIQDRVEVLIRLEHHLKGVPLLDATTAMLYAFQVSYSHLAPATVDIYSRHVKAFYKWCRRSGLVTVDPAEDLMLPKLRKGRPHPTLHSDLATIFGCTFGPLRLAYTLAAFAGLRCGEIARLTSRDINYGPHTTALIHGKGGKERVVPL
jgi:integrase/recombinase XerD